MRFNLKPRSRDQEVINVLWRCTGSELQLLSCSQNQSDMNCNQEAGVYCYGKPKLSMITQQIDLSIQVL